MRRRVAVFVAVMVSSIGGLAIGRAQDEVGDDTPHHLAPAERVGTANPSDAHAASMVAITGEDIAAATERANQLDEARRLAPVDILWGVGR